jgi:hypothetical protein
MGIDVQVGSTGTMLSVGASVGAIVSVKIIAVGIVAIGLGVGSWLFPYAPMSAAAIVPIKLIKATIIVIFLPESGFFSEGSGIDFSPPKLITFPLPLITKLSEISPLEGECGFFVSEFFFVIAYPPFSIEISL